MSEQNLSVLLPQTRPNHSILIMLFNPSSLATLAVLSSSITAVNVPRAAQAGVSGAAEGFAKGVTGGGSATAVYPSTTAELVSYLGDSSSRVIVLTKTFDFTGSEGTTKGTGCAPWGTGSACQVAINKDSWCDNYESSAPKASVS